MQSEKEIVWNDVLKRLMLIFIMRRNLEWRNLNWICACYSSVGGKSDT